jgi:hypothetical protein
MKHRRQINEIAQKQHRPTTDIRLDTWTPINVIASSKTSDPTAFTNFLDNIKFSRDNYFETLIESSFDPICPTSKEKTAITRQYNKCKKAIAKKNKIIDSNDAVSDAEVDYVGSDTDEDVDLYI